MNPHRQTANVIAFLCYILTAVVLFVGTLSTLAAALTDPSQLPVGGVNSRELAMIVATPFVTVAVMLGLFGRRVQTLFGRPYRQERPGTKMTVGCLRLGSVGCGLWAVLAAVITLVTGKLVATGDPAGAREIFIGSTGFILVIALMLSIAWFVSANYAQLKPEERERAYQSYRAALRPRLHRLAEPETRTFVQEQTLLVLGKLDAPLKSAMLIFLSESGLLKGETRVALRDADFRGVNLSSYSLPQADLRGVDLRRAVLQGTMLFEGDLREAKLREADLSRAELQGADLRRADLTGAVLETTNLRGADLTGAKVTHGQLKHARLDGTTTLPDGKKSV
jgi:Pentapeptide repeats (8 copies)